MAYLPINIKEIVEEINNTYFLPHIQRELVWKPTQIYKLFDSLMRGYPISTFLFWKVSSDLDVTKLEFIKDFKKKESKNLVNNGRNKDAYHLVLDGQQRLQSFYISFKGTYDGKDLFLNALSKKAFEEENDDEETEIIYETSFFKYKKTFYFEENEDKKTKQKSRKFWVKIKDFAMLEGDDSSGVRRISKFIENVPKEFKDKLTRSEWELMDDNIKKLNEIITKDFIYYYEEKGKDYNKVLDIFIRTNAGGTRLSKSDLLFSVIKLKWKKIDAYEQFNELIRKINSKGEFEFDNDFILKTSLVLINKDIKYRVENFNEKNVKEIEDNWDNIKESIKTVIDFLVNDLGISSKKQLTSKNSIIPVINYAFINKIKSFETNNIEIKNSKKIIKKWLFSALLTNLFSSQTDELLRKFREVINSNKGLFPLEKLNLNLPQGKSIDISSEIFNKISYNDSNDFFVLGLLYPDFDLNPSSDRNKPHKDHIFPESLLEQKKYASELINNIGNLQFLTATENESKNNTSFENWIENLDTQFTEKSFIPKNKGLWKIEKYEEFIEERRIIMFKRLKDILSVK